MTSDYDAGTLTVASDGASDTVLITCQGTAMKINGADPDDGPRPCTGAGTPGTVTVLGNGGNDTLDVAGITTSTRGVRERGRR